MDASRPPSDRSCCARVVAKKCFAAPSDGGWWVTLCTDSQPSQHLHVRFQLAPANMLMISPGIAQTESPHLSWRMNWLVEVWNLAWIYAFRELVFLTLASLQTRGCTLTKTPDLPLVPFSSHVVPTSVDSFSLNAANLMQREPGFWRCCSRLSWACFASTLWKTYVVSDVGSWCSDVSWQGSCFTVDASTWNIGVEEEYSELQS